MKKHNSIPLGKSEPSVVGIYLRVSTSDKDQNPETQLMPLRDWCEAKGWIVFEVYVDEASAHNLKGRTAWRQMLDDAAKGKFDAVLVFKLDRAFRSVKDMHDTLSVWEMVGVSFLSLKENFDTSTAIGRLMLNLLASVAEFELDLIRERVKAGMDRARRQGKRLGRHKIEDTEGHEDFLNRFAAILPRLSAGEISLNKASKELGVSPRTLRRRIDSVDDDEALAV